METTEVILLTHDGHNDDAEQQHSSKSGRKRTRDDGNTEEDSSRPSKRARTDSMSQGVDVEGDDRELRTGDAENSPVLLTNADGSLVTPGSLAMTPGKKYSAQFVGNGTTYIEDLEVGAIQLPSTPSGNVSRDYTLSTQWVQFTSGTPLTGKVLYYGLGWSPNWVTQDGDYLEIVFAGRFANNANVKNVGVYVGQGISPPLNTCPIPGGFGGSFEYKGIWLRDGTDSCRCSAQIVYSNAAGTGTAMATTLTSHSKEWNNPTGEIVVLGENVITAGDITPLFASLRLKKVTTVV